MMDQWKVGVVRSDQASTIGSDSQRDEHVEVQVTQLLCREVMIRVHSSEYLS